jgi:hypothetical protein
MNIRILVPALVPAVVLAGLLSSPVLAKTYPSTATFSYHAQTAKGPTAAEQCAQLESQFDAAMKTQHPSRMQMNKAQTWGAEGTSLCENRARVEGIKKLDEALNELGTTPKS